MASSIFLASHILPLILFHLLLATQPISSVRIPLTRVSSKARKYRSTNTLNNEPSAALMRSPMQAYNDVYTMSLAIGTPPVPFSAIMDTGSNLIWTKCKTSGSGFFGTGLFDPSKSISFSMLDDTCEGFPDCTMKYDDGLSVSVSLGRDTLTMGGHETINDVTFACGEPIANYEFSSGGIVGMGPGPLSLVSHLTERVFAYCLGSRFGPTASSILLTESEASIQDSALQTVRLGTDEKNYYISLKGISVGQTKLPISIFYLATMNSAKGMVMDSGTTFTYLEKGIIDMISNELVNQMMLEKYTGDDEIYYEELEHCFKQPGNVQFPNVVFHLQGADWVLTRENYIYEKQGKEMACLAFVASYNKEDIFGNMQQQNMMVIYDLDRKSLSFKPATCNEL